MIATSRVGACLRVRMRPRAENRVNANAPLADSPAVNTNARRTETTLRAELRDVDDMHATVPVGIDPVLASLGEVHGVHYSH